MSNLVVVGGGSGFIGKALCRAIEKSGFTAVTITRNNNGKQNALSWEDIERNGLPDNTHAVINVAGEPAINFMRRWNDNFISDIFKSRIGTTGILKRALLDSVPQPKYWASISAVGYYKPNETKIYDENAPAEDDNFWSNMVIEWEKAGQLPKDCSVRHCIIRSGVVLGKDGGSFPKMLMPFRFGFGGPVGSGKQWFPWIHIDDMVGIFMHALSNENVSGVLNGVAPEICTNGEFTRTFGSVLNRPTFFTTPSFVLNTLLGPIPASLLLEGQNVYPKRTLDCGYKYLFPSISSALKDLVA